MGVGEPSGTQPGSPSSQKSPCSRPRVVQHSRDAAEAAWRGNARVTSKWALTAPDPKLKNWLCHRFCHLGQVTTPLWVSVASSMKWR